jgi:hypothetical protein
MARPKKDKSDRKSSDLRIPLTEGQKELIVQAARLAGIDMAAWARPIILQAAKEFLDDDKK